MAASSTEFGTLFAFEKGADVDAASDQTVHHAMSFQTASIQLRRKKNQMDEFFLTGNGGGFHDMAGTVRVMLFALGARDLLFTACFTPL